MYKLSNDIFNNIISNNSLNKYNIFNLILTNKIINFFIKKQYKYIYKKERDIYINLRNYNNTFEVNLYLCNIYIDNFDNLLNINILDARCCNLNNNVIPYLKNIKECDLASNSDITNVNSLYKLQKLDLSNCNKIIDVSMLGNIYDLNLSHCEKIIDVSKLGNNKILDLKGCNISNVNSLGNVYSLDLSYNNYISNISRLNNNYELNISRCNNITNFLSLKNIIKLNLEECKQEIILPNFIKIKYLNVKYSNLVYLPNLCNMDYLNIEYCNNIKNIYILNNIKEVFLNKYSIYTRKNIINCNIFIDNYCNYY